MPQAPKSDPPARTAHAATGPAPGLVPEPAPQPGSFALKPSASWLLAAGLAALFAWCYWPTLAALVHAWNTSADYSHGYFVPFLALYFMWARRGSMPQRLAPSWMGLSIVVAAGLVRLLSARLYYPELDGWSIPLWLGGLAWILGGRALAVWCLPSLCFLGFMVPLPSRVELMLSLPLQRLATTSSTWVLQSLGRPALAEGTTILLYDFVLEVERACSGLRMFFGMTALAVAHMVIFPRPWWHRGVLAGSVVPIALVVNTARLTATGLVYERVSGEAARRLTHDFAGWVMIPLALLLFAGVAWLVSRLATQSRPRQFLRLAQACAAAAVIASSMYFWHRSQVQSNADALLLRATALERRPEDLARAADYLHRYLRLRPDDALVMVRLAKTFDRAVDASSRDPRNKLRALQLYTNAARATAHRPDLVRRQAELALEAKQFDLALLHAQQLLDTGQARRRPNASQRAAAMRVKALALSARAMATGVSTSKLRSETVIEALKQAIVSNPADMSLAVQLARIYLHHARRPDAVKRQALADAVINHAVKANPTLPEALLARYLYRCEYHRPAASDEEGWRKIDADLDRAVALGRADPESVRIEVLLTAAQRAMQRGRNDEAREFYESVIAVRPRDFRAYAALGLLEAGAGTPAAAQRAIGVWKQGLAALGREELGLTLPLAETLVRLGRETEANGYLDRMQAFAQQYPGPERPQIELAIDLVRAEADRRAGRIARSMQILRDRLASDRTASMAEANPALVAKAWSNLGGCYEMLLAGDLAADAHNRAAALEPDLARARKRAGEACQAVGRFEAALGHFRAAARAPDSSANDALAYARACLDHQTRLPSSQRNWREFEEARLQAQTLGGDSVTLLLLDADRLVTDGRSLDALAQLREAAGARGDSAILWQALAIAEGRWGDRRLADMPVDAFERLTKKPARAARLRALVMLSAQERDAAHKLLVSALASARGEERHDLILTIAQLELQSGKRRAARERLEDLWRQTPTVELAGQLAELASEEADWKGVKRWETRLRQSEGPQGTLYRDFEARRLLAESAGLDDPKFFRAVQLQQELERLRPSWPRTAVLEGHIARKEGRTSDAIRAYRRAQQLGDQTIALAESMIELLFNERRLEEVDRQLERVSDYVARSDRLSTVAIPMYVQRGESERAVKLAEDWVRRRPRDPLMHIRLGRTLILTSRAGGEKEAHSALDGAERAFRRAVDLGPADVRAWAVLFQFYAATLRDPQAAQAILDQLSRREDIERAKRDFVLAQLHESIGDMAQARRYYLQSVKHHGDMPDVLALAARFFLTRDEPLAESYCRRLLELKPGNAWARQALISMLADSGDPSDLREAFALVPREAASAATRAADRSLMARLLLRRGEPGDRAKALKLLEELTRDQRLETGDDRLRLAALYEADRRILPAHEQLRLALEDPEPALSHQVAFVEFLHRHRVGNPQFVREARKWIDRLESTSGQAALALRYRLRFAGAGAGAEASVKGAVEAYLERHVQPLSGAARDQEFLNLLVALAREEQSGEAAQLCSGDPPLVDPPSQAVCLATAFSLALPEPDALAAAEVVWEKALAQYPSHTDLFISLANLRLMQDRKSEAVELYRKALAVDPDHIMALNNLASTLLEQSDGREEARRAVDRAIELARAAPAAGYMPILLDTQAMVMLRQGQVEAAVQSLNKALDAPRPDPRFLFHLAWAHHQAGNQPAARQALHRARARNLNASLLTPQERTILAQLTQTVAQSTTEPEKR